MRDCLSAREFSGDRDADADGLDARKVRVTTSAVADSPAGSTRCHNAAAARNGCSWSPADISDRPLRTR